MPSARSPSPKPYAPSDRWIWLTEYNNENGKWSAPLKIYAPRPFAADNNSIQIYEIQPFFVMGSAVTKEFNVKLCVGRECICRLYSERDMKPVFYYLWCLVHFR